MGALSLFCVRKTQLRSFELPAYRRQHFKRFVTIVKIPEDESLDCTISLACGELHFRSQGVGPLYDLLKYMGGPDCHEPHAIPIDAGSLSIVFDREYFDTFHLTLNLTTSFLTLTIDTDADRQTLVGGLAEALRKL